MGVGVLINQQLPGNRSHSQSGTEIRKTCAIATCGPTDGKFMSMPKLWTDTGCPSLNLREFIQKSTQNIPLQRDVPESALPSNFD